MTEQITRNGTLAPLPRCCDRHSDWPTLSLHLAEEFPEVRIVDIVREVRQAHDAVTTAGLAAEEALDTGEAIVRHQLMLLSGRSVDVARLDPERHSR